MGIDSHIELISHYYSVPHRFAREQVDVRYTTSSVDIFHRGKRIAAHARSERRGAHLLGGRQHPQQVYRACLGVLRLAKDYGNARLEAASARAIDLKAPNYLFIDSTLKNGLDQQPSPVAAQADLPLTHANVRGPNYYH